MPLAAGLLMFLGFWAWWPLGFVVLMLLGFWAWWPLGLVTPPANCTLIQSTFGIG